jgi:hypothetical protein
MTFAGRTAELGRLRAALDRSVSSLIRITGVRGGGKTTLVERVLPDYDHLLHRAPPLPDQAQRSAFARLVARTKQGGIRSTNGGLQDQSWSKLLMDALSLGEPGRRPLVIVFDDVHRLREARSRYIDGVVSLLEAARRNDRALHVVLVGPSDSMPRNDERLGTFEGESLWIAPLPFRPACSLLPGSRPAELTRAYCVFGGIPRVLVSLDPDVTVGTNIRRLMLSPAAALSDFGGTWLERDVQTPARYYAILRSLAHGEADWSTIHAGLPDLTRSGQVAPYLKRLEELGLVIARRSLDSQPGARSTRYAVADPFIAFWARFLLDAHARGRGAGSTDFYGDVVRPEIEAHSASIFPVICRQHVARDAVETIGSRARESGSLWGPHYDIPVAGILTSGAAYYGTCHWEPTRPADDPLAALDRQVRETRYGFGREARVRLVFTRRDPPRALQRAVARRHDAYVIDAAALMGH